RFPSRRSGDHRGGRTIAAGWPVRIAWIPEQTETPSPLSAGEPHFRERPPQAAALRLPSETARRSSRDEFKENEVGPVMTTTLDLEPPSDSGFTIARGPAASPTVVELVRAAQAGDRDAF